MSNQYLREELRQAYTAAMEITDNPVASSILVLASAVDELGSSFDHAVNRSAFDTDTREIAWETFLESIGLHIRDGLARVAESGS